MKAKELRAQRAKLIADARKLVDAASAEKRSLTPEEDAKFDAMMADADKHEADALRLEKLEAEERSLGDSQGRKTDPNPPGKTDPDQTEGEDNKPSDRRATPEYRSMFHQYLMHGFNGIGPVEQRALQADLDVSGGYLVTPTQMASELIKFVDDAVYIRQMATVIPVTSAQSLGAPSLDTDVADADWTSEIKTGSEDSSMAFGKRELNPHPLAKRIKVSNKLLRMAANSEDLVRQRLAYKFAIAEENAFLNGTGVNQPLGVFTASTLGISTGRDVSTGNTATEMTPDGLLNAIYSLKEQHQKAAEWMFHRDGIKQIRKMKDGNGQYLWSAGVAAGQPNMICDRPYRMSEYVPNTFTSGLYVGIIGNWKYYWIADALSFVIQRLIELYAESGQIGFIGRLEVDGMPVLEEAFARVKLG